ncbi:hypothetical protein AXG93_48s1160 [Marchantia polymorpha subsp. ruderalis]|uniref:Uncharacterized protein n=1 Tax=Marchantia polymorpha subsp. ruderalis TaxID=1480154 RepID=A0A176VVD0_MARPO|nr:hypothetical protein AXG93_48s1160 [Marchantia polymorpha subsp. ruderalis]
MPLEGASYCLIRIFSHTPAAARSLTNIASTGKELCISQFSTAVALGVEPPHLTRLSRFVRFNLGDGIMVILALILELAVWAPPASEIESREGERERENQGECACELYDRGKEKPRKKREATSSEECSVRLFEKRGMGFEKILGGAGGERGGGRLTGVVMEMDVVRSCIVGRVVASGAGRRERQARWRRGADSNCDPTRARATGREQVMHRHEP